MKTKKKQKLEKGLVPGEKDWRIERKVRVTRRKFKKKNGGGISLQLCHGTKRKVTSHGPKNEGC